MKIFSVVDQYTSHSIEVDLVKETKCYYVVTDSLKEYRFHKATMVRNDRHIMLVITNIEMASAELEELERGARLMPVTATSKQVLEFMSMVARVKGARPWGFVAWDLAPLPWYKKAQGFIAEAANGRM
jgi:hypothetical protein